MDRLLILAENDAMAAGSFDDVARTMLSSFKDEAWHIGHATALASYVSTNTGSLHARVNSALNDGLKAALDASPSGERQRLDDETRTHFANARTRLQASLPSKPKQAADAVTK